ncbi:MAG TPA: hypothetical protein GX738_00780 [Firmicutes bacterium]|nr:hypothetical protein [Bacillota bacterium]
MLKKLRALLPKEKSPEELDEHYRQIEEIKLEKGDMPAMLIAAFLTLGVPLLLIAGAIYGFVYLALAR